MDFLNKYFQKNQVYLFFIVLTWFSYFFYCSQFGLYEDDYFFVGHSINQSFNLQWLAFKNEFVNFIQGRPVGFFILRFATYILYSVGGLWTCYLGALAIISLNSILFFNILKSRFPERVAFFGALAFMLFPADTSKMLLIHAYTLQVSLLTMLLSYHFYYKRNFVLSYICVLLSLLNYESAILPCLLMPIFYSNDNFKNAFRKLLINSVIFIAIIAVIFFVRKSIGESRVSSMEYSTVIDLTIKSLYEGPFAVLRSFYLVPIITFLNWSNTFPFVSISFALISGFYYKYRNRIDLNNQENNILKSILLCFLYLISSYLLSFTHYPPTTLIGRLTSVHLSATFGGSLLIGLICSLIVSSFKSNKYIRGSLVFLSIFYFSLLSGYGSVIQFDLKDSWANQKKFWTKVIKECHDLKENSLVFVINHEMQPNYFVETYSWTEPMIPSLIFKFPSHWKTSPKLISVDKDWISLVKNDTINGYYWEPENYFLFDGNKKNLFRNSDFILLEYLNGEIKRLPTPEYLTSGSSVAIDHYHPLLNLGNSFLDSSNNEIRLNHLLFDPREFKNLKIETILIKEEKLSIVAFEKKGIFLHPGAVGETGLNLNFKLPVTMLKFEYEFTPIEDIEKNCDKNSYPGEINLTILGEDNQTLYKKVIKYTDQNKNLIIHFEPRKNLKVLVNKGEHDLMFDGIYVKNLDYR